MDKFEKRILRVGVAQMFLRRSLKENLHQILKMMSEARNEGCDVAVFSENILCDLEETASALDFDQAVGAIQKHALECDLNVVVGVSASVIHQSHNRALVVDRKNKRLLYYQKNTEVPQRIWIDDIPCAVAICSDRWYIEHADLSCLTQGAKIMIDISGGHGGDDGRPNLRWVRYRCWAIRNSAFVVVCNMPHDDEPDYMGNKVWGGHSAILDASGTFLNRADYERDLIITADLEIEQATRANATRRRNHPLLKPWWDMGKDVLEGRRISVPTFTPLESRETEIKIAAAQIASALDVDENVTKITEYVKMASSDGADVVVFPERAVTVNAKAATDAVLLTQALESIQECVQKNRVYAIVGMPYVENGHLFNSAVVIHPNGDVLTRYNQISACSADPFSAGNSTRGMWFEINGIHATVTIGEDLYWPELTELAAYRGMQLHFHLDSWHGSSDDANLVRKHSAINYLMPAVCGVWMNAANPGASGGSLLLRRVGGHGQPNPGGVEAYLPYHTSVVKTGGTDEETLYFTAKTNSRNDWQSWRNRTRKNRKGSWWEWICQGVQTVHSR